MSNSSGFQTKKEIKALLDAAGVFPKKRFGQCFLIDRNLMQQVIEAADVGPVDWVLEVGCGTGSLTAQLLQLAGRVIAVEIDTDLQAIITETIGDADHFRFIRGDVLARKSEIAPEVADAIASARRELPGRGRLVANLPYDVATSLIVDLLLGEYGIDRYCFTVQLEVAERFRASPGEDAFGAVSVIAQTFADVGIVAKLPPQAFWPAPKVHSAIVRMDVRADPPIAMSNAKHYAPFVRSVFQTRRKGLQSTLKRLDDSGRDVAGLLSKLELPTDIRPERIGIREWVGLYRAWVCPEAEY